MQETLLGITFGNCTVAYSTKLAGYEKGLVIRMKRKWILVGGFLCVILLLLVILIFYLHERRDKDLFKHESPVDILAMEEEPEQKVEAAGGVSDTTIKSDSSLSTNSQGLKVIVGEKITEESKKSERSEEPKKGEEPIIDSKDQHIVEQQEAAMETGEQNSMDSFYYEELTQATKDRINGISYGENCDIPYEELRYVSVLHWGFDGQSHRGELIVNKAIAEDVTLIFAELYEAKYPIERMVLVDEYDADDNTSMAANNSSAFNYRVIEGTKRISLHSYGMAIDINPLYNPYVHEVDGERVVTPVEGAMYEDRSLECPYYIHSEDVCYQAFIKRGFTWGGDWMNTKDYQHFQKALPVEGSGRN